MIKNVIVSGGYGFIGSALCRYLHKNTNYQIILIDKLTYASNLNSLKEIINDKRITFYKGSIGNRKLIQGILEKHRPHYIFNLAAETHVDNSIKNPSIFVKTNVLDTHIFVEEVLAYYKNIDKKKPREFKFLHVSTDEVYGDIDLNDEPVSELAQYKPSSPYSATKASSDHIVTSYYRTFGLPILVTHCSNNYGPYQNKEKFLPTIIQNILKNKPIPVYGDGTQIREWLFVDDHCDALLKLMMNGEIGEHYNISNSQGITNLDFIKKILNSMYQLSLISNQSFYKYIKFVPDRLGHDRRYAINCSKITKSCGWKPLTNLDKGIDITIKSFLEVDYKKES
jgi:dTDP-glucose 4,6-dehydratase